MRKYLRNIARNRIFLMGGSNKAMKKMWRRVLFGDLAEQGHMNQMKLGRMVEARAQGRKVLKNRRMVKISE